MLVGLIAIIALVALASRSAVNKKIEGQRAMVGTNPG